MRKEVTSDIICEAERWFGYSDSDPVTTVTISGHAYDVERELAEIRRNREIASEAHHTSEEIRMFLKHFDMPEDFIWTEEAKAVYSVLYDRINELFYDLRVELDRE